MLFFSIKSKILKHRGVAKNLFISNKDITPEIYFVYLDPKEIKHTSLISECPSIFCGPKAFFGVYNGHWDNLCYPFKKNVIARLTRTVYHGNYKNNIVFRWIKFRNGNLQAEWMVRKILNIMELFLRTGYLSQYELDNLGKTFQVGNIHIPRHETLIAMNRKGEFIRLVGGRHRLAVAQELGIKEMPAILTMIHEDARDKLPSKRRLITGNKEDFRPFDN
jgi:hypothetical protein